MLKRELIRIVAFGGIGLFIGIFIFLNGMNLNFIFIIPLYAIGSFYGIRFILGMLGGAAKAAAMSMFASIAFGNFVALIVIGIVFLLMFGAILSFGWVIGIFVALKALFDAYKIDLDLKSNGTIRDTWDKSRYIASNNTYDDDDW